MSNATTLGMFITITVIMVSLGVGLPYINSAFNEPTNEINEEGILTKVGDQVGFGEIIASLSTIFFWNFGDAPFFVDAILWMLRVTFYVVLYLFVRSGN